MSGGVPAGATRANQAVDSKSAKPLSIKVGTSGNDADRAVLPTASGRRLPARTNGSDDTRLSNIISTLPATRIVQRRAVPR